MQLHVWSKYIPVVKILLKKSVSGPQKMGLNRIDFEKNSRSRKPSCSFAIELVKGRFATVSQSGLAKELVALLLDDEAMKALLRENDYRIALGSDFQLTITNRTAAAAVAQEPVAPVAMEN